MFGKKKDAASANEGWPELKAGAWSAAASPHLYGSRPVRSYIIEVTLASEVQEKPLQEALDKVVERAPYYAQTFVCIDGLYYDAQNEKPMRVAHKKGFRQLGTEETLWHMMDITYDENVIYFAAAHALADGEAFTWFVESVLYYYFCAKDATTYSSEGIMTLDTPSAEDELLDVFAVKRKSHLLSMLGILINHNAVLPECEGEYGNERWRYPLQIPTDELLAWTKAHKTSPAPALAGMIAKVIVRENPGLKGKLNVCVQMTLRKLLGASHTLKNCIGVAYLPFDKQACADTAVGELASQARTALKEQICTEYAEKMAGMQGFAFRTGKRIPLQGARNMLMGLLELSPFDTVSVDYAGRPRMGEYADQVEAVSYYFSEVFKGTLYLIMSECAGKFLINFVQTFQTDRYYQGFLRVLDEEGISYTTLPAVTYLSPEVVQQH